MFLLRVDEFLRRVHTVMELPEAGLYTVLRLPLVGHTLNLVDHVQFTPQRRHEITNVRLAADFVRFTPESSRKTRQVISAAIDP